MYLVDARGRKRVVIVGREGGDPVASLLSLSPTSLWIPLPQYLTADEDGTGSVAAGGTVGRVTDIGAAGSHLLQSTAGLRPVYQTDGQRHWLEFDGADDILSATFTARTQPWERVSAFRKIDALPVADNDVFLCAPNSFTGQLYITDAGELRISSGTELGGLAGPAVGADFVAVERHNGVSSRVKFNNGTYNTGNAGTTAPEGVNVGATGAGEFGFHNMRFYGCAMLDGTWSDEQIAIAQKAMGRLAGVEL